MELHTEGRSTGATGKVLNVSWLTRDASAAARGPRQVFSFVMLVIGRHLRVWVIGVPPRPKEARRVLPRAGRETYLPAGMIRPSMHHRVTIASRRDDWP